MYLMGNSHVAILLLTIIQNINSVSLIPTVTNEWSEFSKIFASIRAATLFVTKGDANVRKNVSLCLRDITSISEGAFAGEKWALQMLDASSKIPAGILKGNVHDLGMYDQCMEVEAESNPAKIKGEHCMVSLSVPSGLFVDESMMLLMQKISPLGRSTGDALSMSLSMCLPSSCHENDVHRMMNGIIDQTPVLARLGISVAEVKCSRVEDQDFTLGETLATILIAMIVIFLIFCTICGFVRKTKRDESVACTLLAPLSLHTNSKDLLKTEVAPGTMPAINGLRVLSICWVIIVHRGFITAITPIANLADMLESQNRWYALIAFMTTFVVDTSFVISGFLATYHFLKSFHSGDKFSLPMIYLHRYIRLTPCLAAMILLTVFQLRHIGSGPVWNNSLSLMVEPCKENWWVNLLYVQNIVNTDRMCLPHTWYLAADMQLFWISRIILYALVRWPKHARKILVLAFLTSVITPSVLFLANGHSNTFFKVTQDTSASEFRANFVNVYMSAIHRSSAYLVGVALGYLIVHTKIRLTMLQAKINWAVACILMSLCVVATHHLYSTTYVYDVVFESVYAALARPAWAIAISWIVYATTQGYGDLATRFLSSPVFLPLGRLSYCIYLVHTVIQISTAALTRTPIVATNFQIFQLFWSDMAMSIGLGFLLSLVFEIPVKVLERILRNNARGQKAISKDSPSEISRGCVKSTNNGTKID